MWVSQFINCNLLCNNGNAGKLVGLRMMFRKVMKTFTKSLN